MALCWGYMNMMAKMCYASCHRVQPHAPAGQEDQQVHVEHATARRATVEWQAIETACTPNFFLSFWQLGMHA